MIISTEKVTRTDCEAHFKFVNKTLRKHPLFHFVTFKAKTFWEVLLFKDPENFIGMISDNNGYVVVLWLFLCCPTILQLSYSFLALSLRLIGVSSTSYLKAYKTCFYCLWLITSRGYTTSDPKRCLTFAQRTKTGKKITKRRT